jgi:hypothetical protein
MRRVRQLWRGDSGSVLIFVAVTIFALAAMVILAVDISKLLVTRAQLQNAADAGALAGAELFMESGVTPVKSDVEQHARDVAALNRAFNESYDSPVSQVSDIEAVAVTDAGENYGTVTVTTRSVVSQYFTGVLRDSEGLPLTGRVAAIAAARAGEVCAVQCLKPWSIPDRWDDSGRPGWPAWKNNDHWDAEAFTDLNENGVRDANEPFTDGVDMNKAKGPKDGQYTQEFYHPLLTGYIASKDLGELMRFKVADPNDASMPGQFYPIDLCQGEDARNCPGANNYEWNIANCNPRFYKPGDWVKTENGNMIGPTGQGLRDLIAQDPTAAWSDGCQCVVNSKFSGTSSPRIGFIPLHDPRIPLDSGKMSIQIVKIIAVFFEQVEGRDVMARFIRVQAPGEQCPPGQQGGGYVFNLSLIR